MANNGLPGHASGTSAYPPTSDIRWPMTGFGPIWSDLGPGGDGAGLPPLRLEGPMAVAARQISGNGIIHLTNKKNGGKSKRSGKPKCH